MQRFKSSGSARSFSPHTPPSKTASTSNAISHPAARSASSETKRSGRGDPPPRPELELRLPIFTLPKFGSRQSTLAPYNLDEVTSNLVMLPDHRAK